LRELWISKRTGRRRTGTRVSELRRIFETGITAQAIYEPLQCCASYDLAAEIAEKMRQLDFDVLGVKDSEGEPVIGYVNVCDMNPGQCRESLHIFGISDLISDSTPLISVLSILHNKSRVFVLSGNSAVGIITRADLQKPPVRILLFGLVSLLETHLSYLVRKFYKEGSWKKKLSETRISKAEKILKQRKARNENMDLSHCLQFCDKRDLITAHSEIRQILDLKSNKKGKKLLEDIEKLRDKLAHSQDIIEGTTWEEIIDLTGNLEKLIQLSEKCVDTAAESSDV
jgi:hypothetical protein